jgi:hypothetical protein
MAQLKATAITVKTGLLVDATVITSGSEGDADGRWVKHKGKPPVHGFKAHVGADATNALVEKVSTTPATSMMGALVHMPCQTTPERCSPTVLIAARSSATRCEPGGVSCHWRACDLGAAVREPSLHFSLSANPFR